ncbi:MAG: hypothetical protein CBC01_07855 [Betaproteobacteria bacterium TMED41]|nr:MAG: hypothetical protein CBC01_07855 [Betaproteobacteria bacterium TMED41]
MNNIDVPPLMPDFFSMFGSFVLVLLLLGIVLFILRKVQMTNTTSKNGRKIQILEIVPTNNKQKIMLLKVDDQKFLIGISGQNMNQLGHWNTSGNFAKTEKPSANDFNLNLVNDPVSSKTNSSMNETSHIKNTKTKIIESEKTDPLLTSSNVHDESETLSKVSSLKQTEDLLSFAKKIRGSLNQSIDRAQRTQ